MNFTANATFTQTTDNVSSSLNFWTIKNYDSSTIMISNQTELGFPEGPITEVPIGAAIKETVEAAKRLFSQ
jgi:hypothetical protein